MYVFSYSVSLQREDAILRRFGSPPNLHVNVIIANDIMRWEPLGVEYVMRAEAT